MTRTVRTLSGVIVCLAAGTLRAQSPEAAPVVAAVQQLFDAMARRDTAAARRLLLPGARFVSTVIDPAAVPGRPRAQNDSAFIQSLGAGSERLLERMWSPVVRVDGALATLWTPYDFHIDGRFSHCGIDAVSLLRTSAGWQVAGIVYTVQRQGCAPSPLGAPK